MGWWLANAGKLLTLCKNLKQLNLFQNSCSKESADFYILRSCKTYLGRLLLEFRDIFLWHTLWRKTCQRNYKKVTHSIKWLDFNNFSCVVYIFCVFIKTMFDKAKIYCLFFFFWCERGGGVYRRRDSFSVYSRVFNSSDNCYFWLDWLILIAWIFLNLFVVLFCQF